MVSGNDDVKGRSIACFAVVEDRQRLICPVPREVLSIIFQLMR